MRYLIFILLLVGCESYSPPIQLATTEATHEQANVKTASIREDINAVDEIVEKAIKDDDTSGLPAVKPHTDKVRTDSIIIDSLVLDLVNSNMTLLKENRALKKELAEMKDKKSFKHKLPWVLGGLGVLCVALGLFFGRHKITVAGMLIGGSSFGVITYYEWLERILPAMLIVCVGFILFVINHERQEKAIEEIRDDDIND